MMTASTSEPVAKAGCARCVMRGLGLCSLLIDLGSEKPFPKAQRPFGQEKKWIAARRPVVQRKEFIDGVPVLCEGWALRMLRLSNGRRQILSFLLPGEMLAAELIFKQQVDFSIEAITSVCFRIFERPQLHAAMFASRELFDTIFSAYNDEKSKAEQLIADLGRRTATERVARLLLDIWDGSEKLGMVVGNRIEFPLRQSHIADATGLTQVYVSKVLGNFRNSGLVQIRGRTLEIADMTKLRRLVA